MIPVSKSARRTGRVIIGAVLLAFCAMCGLGATTIQGLPRARIGIVGSVDPSMLTVGTGQPPTLMASLPGGYGLTPSEVRQGLPALNKVGGQEAVLSGPITVAFPPTSYCVTHFIWQPTPPPPALFILRFSDAPAEEYMVWRTGYFVRRNGIHVPNEQATWRLQVGAFDHDPRDEERPPLWLLHVQFIRQSPARSGDSQPAST